MCTYVHVCVALPSLCVCGCLRMRARGCVVRMWTLMHAFFSMHTYWNIACVRACMPACERISACMCLCTCAYARACVRACVILFFYTISEVVLLSLWLDEQKWLSEADSQWEACDRLLADALRHRHVIDVKNIAHVRNIGKCKQILSIFSTFIFFKSFLFLWLSWNFIAWGIIYFCFVLKKSAFFFKRDNLIVVFFSLIFHWHVFFQLLFFSPYLSFTSLSCFFFPSYSDGQHWILWRVFVACAFKIPWVCSLQRHMCRRARSR